MASGIGSTVGLVLQLNGANDLMVNADGSFAFSPRLAGGTAYTVTLKSSPAGRTCMLSNASGQIGMGDVTSVQVACAVQPAPSPPQGMFTVGGTVSGLVGTGLALRNGSETLQVPANATGFTFATALATGTMFQASIDQQPSNPAQVCNLAGGSGTVGSANVTSLVVTCTMPAAPSVVMLDKSSLTFTAEEGEAVDPQSVTGTVIGVVPADIRVAFTKRGLSVVELVELSDTSARLDVRPIGPMFLGAGVYMDTITVTICLDIACSRQPPGSPVQIPVTYTVTRNPPPALLLSDTGVAFAATPSGTRLTRTLTVDSATAMPLAWTASADQPQWLQVTPSGVAPGSLTLTANQAGLANGFYEARVTVTPGDAAIDPRVIRVGLYVSSTPAASQLAQLPVVPNLAVPPERRDTFAVDPIRPLLYSTSGSTLAVDHVYTGERIGSLEIPGGILRDVVASNDGSRLYVLNRVPDSTVVVVDLDAWRVIGSYRLSQFDPTPGATIGPPYRLTYADVSGRSVLILNNQRRADSSDADLISPVLDAQTGLRLGAMFASSAYRGLFAVSRDGRVLYAVERGISGNLSVHRFDVRVSSRGTIYSTFSDASDPQSVANATEIATNQDGSRVFVVYLADSFVRSFRFVAGSLVEGTQFGFTVPPNVLSVGISPRNVEFDSYGRFVTALGGFDFRLHAADDTVLQQSIEFGSRNNDPATAGSLRISSDGLRAINFGFLLDLVP